MFPYSPMKEFKLKTTGKNWRTDGEFPTNLNGVFQFYIQKSVDNKYRRMLPLWILGVLEENDGGRKGIEIHLQGIVVYCSLPLKSTLHYPLLSS